MGNPVNPGNQVSQVKTVNPGNSQAKLAEASRVQLATASRVP